MLIGYRKFIIMSALIILGIVFRLTDMINGSEMVSLLKVCASAFFASNLFSKITHNKGEK